MLFISSTQNFNRKNLDELFKIKKIIDQCESIEMLDHASEKLLVNGRLIKNFELVKLVDRAYSILGKKYQSKVINIMKKEIDNDINELKKVTKKIKKYKLQIKDWEI
jgi:hypothetical protein